MNVLFWGPGDFPVSYSNRGTSWNAWNRHSGSFMSIRGSYSACEVSLLRMLNGILTLHQQWLPNQSDFPPISWPWYRLWPSPNHEWCQWSICNGCGMPAGNAYPSGHLVPSPHFGTYLCSNCWDQIPRTCHVFTRLFTSNTPWYFLDFACSISESEITFLDTTIYKGERFMGSRILDNKSYIKTTNNFQYLHRSSSHPKSVFTGLVKGECIRHKNSWNRKRIWF